VCPKNKILNFSEFHWISGGFLFFASVIWNGYFESVEHFKKEKAATVWQRTAIEQKIRYN
jgi:hypothetical protein